MKPRAIIPVWALLAAAGAIIGLLMTQADRRRSEDRIRRDLTLAADAYVKVLDHWLWERMGDAAILQLNSVLANYLSGLDERGQVPASRAARARSILDNVAAIFGFQGVFLLDLRGRIQIESEDAVAHHGELLELGLEASRTGRILHEPPHIFGEGEVHMEFAAPVRAEIGPGLQVEGRIVGSVVMLADPLGPPHDLLPESMPDYPTGEAVLVTPQEEGVLFISGLNYVEGRPRGIFIADPDTSLAAVAALSGGTSYGTYTDYRGTPVFAATHWVREAGWGLVVKVDREDAMAPWRQQRLNTIVIVVSLFLAYSGIALAVIFGQNARNLVRTAESARQFQELFENNPQPMMVYDSETMMFLDVNRSATELYGWSREEFQNMTIWGIRPPNEVVRLRQFVSERPTAQIHAGEWRHMTRDGRELTVEVSSAAIEFQGRPARIVIPVDMTEQRSLEAQLLQSQKMEAVGRLAGGIAHDFNNMLTAIIGYAQLVHERLGEGSKEHDGVDRIISAAHRAETLTRQLLAFSRRQIMQPQVLDLNGVTESMGDLLERLIGEDIALVTIPSKDLGCVSVDPGQIEQVIMNLAVNARDAMPGGGRLTIGTRNAEVDDRYARQHPDVRPGPYVLLSVSDTGSGMEPAVAQRAFEPFFTTKEPGKGTGLGLATVFGIVKQSGGHVAIYSELGRGTSLKVYLPRVPCRDLPAGEVALEEGLQTGTEVVLVVEDDKMVRELSAEVLRQLGYTVLAADSGPAAIQLVDGHDGEIQLLLTDVVMPGMGGRELADQIKARRADISVLFTSGYTDEAIVNHGILEQGINFIQKPYSPLELARKIRSMLDA